MITTQDAAKLITDFTTWGCIHAEATYARHVEAYCKDGLPFLQGKELEDYAFQMVEIIFECHFDSLSEEELHDFLAHSNVPILVSLYMQMFIARYRELLPGQGRE